DIYYDRCKLEIQPHAAGIGAEEDAAIGVVAELLDELTAIAAGNAAVKQNVPPLALLRGPYEQLVHPQPLAEDHSLGVRAFEQFAKQGHDLAGLQSFFGLRVEEVTGVARHSHVWKRNHQPLLARFGENLEAPPLLHDAGHFLLVLGVEIALERRHGNEDC